MLCCCPVKSAHHGDGAGALVLSKVAATMSACLVTLCLPARCLPPPPCVAQSVLLLQVISLEGWVDIMYYVQDAHSFWDWIYFVLLIVVSKAGFCRVFSMFPGYKSGGMGKYNVLCSGRPFLLGLDLFCIIDCGKWLGPAADTRCYLA